MQTQKQSKTWRIYAVAMASVIGTSHLSYILQGRPLGGWRGALPILLAIFAVNLWAFGFRMGAPVLWRIFAAAFIPYTLWTLGGIALDLLRMNPDAKGWPTIPADISTIIAFALLCMALIKMAWKRRPLHAHAADAAQPILDARLAAIKRAYSSH
ncbi:MAG: hypothetical protein DI606_13370 [Sphingobium sp.]|uniref:hypothetical protein n=1 Tax=Sphingobium sp. TaxID=1912891 RepID=UPI000DB6107E|nr:hypothetical protein [Sphingobium sp.]PZU09934.1 MAG: hypothetical protein DI606_13370 [Sphingobium sp.]